MYSKVESEPKHEVSTIEREFKFTKIITFNFCFGWFNNCAVTFNVSSKSVFEIVSNTGFKHGRVFNSLFIGFLNSST